jgi:hypothetical protein
MYVAALARALAPHPKQTAVDTMSRWRRRKNKPAPSGNRTSKPDPHDQHGELAERPEEHVSRLVDGDVEVHEDRGLVVLHEREPTPHGDQEHRPGRLVDGQAPLDVVGERDGCEGVHPGRHRHRGSRR